jgi:hypothetical protein
MATILGMAVSGITLTITGLAVGIGTTYALYKNPNPQALIMILAGLSFVAYAFSENWRNPAGFQNFSGDKLPGNADKDGYVYLDGNIVAPYVTEKIQSVDDYEYSLVFGQEGDRAMTKANRDLLMSKYPMDWTTRPPSSEAFQQGLAEFKESFSNPVPQTSVNPFKEIDGSTMTPPDLNDEQKKENEIMSTYIPKKAASLTTYDVADAKELVDKIYAAKGLYANMKKTGDNMYTIVDTLPIDHKVVYEDEVNPGSNAPSSTQAVPAIGEGTIQVPNGVFASVQTQGVDPFFTPSATARERTSKWDYTAWTPGLERAFAPNQPTPNWY